MKWDPEYEPLFFYLEKKSTSRRNIVVLCCKDGSELVTNGAVYRF